MTEQLQNGAIHLHRADILDGLRALYLTQLKFDRFLKEDSYACGYREGFEDALLSIAQMVGVLDEFKAVGRDVNSYKIGSLPVLNSNGR